MTIMNQTSIRLTYSPFLHCANPNISIRLTLVGGYAAMKMEEGDSRRVRLVPYRLPHRPSEVSYGVLLQEKEAGP